MGTPIQISGSRAINATYDAAVILGIKPRDIRAFTHGFDTGEAFDLNDESWEFADLGIRFRDAYEAELKVSHDA